MNDNNTDDLVDGFLRNDHEMVLGKVAGYRGKTLVDVRVYVPSVLKSGEWRPTTKGVAIAIEQFAQVRDAVRELWDAPENTTTAQIEKNKRESIWVGVHTFRGAEYCYLRTYYMDRSGDWKPTKKGISVPQNMLAELDTLLEAISERLEREYA